MIALIHEFENYIESIDLAVDNIVSKTRKLTGMVYRQFYQWSDPRALR